MNVYRFPIGDFTLDERRRADVKQMGPRAAAARTTEHGRHAVYHVVGHPEPGVHAERFGTMLGINQVLFWEVRFANGEGRAERDEVIESVLATGRPADAARPILSAGLGSPWGCVGKRYSVLICEGAGPTTRSTRPSMVARTTYCALPCVTVASSVVASSQTTSLTAAADRASLPLTKSTTGSPVVASRMPTVGDPSGPSRRPARR